MTVIRRISNAVSRRVKRYFTWGKLALLFIPRSLFKKKSGINLIGYFSYTFGVAEVGKFFAQHIKKADIPFLIYDIESPYHKKLDTIGLQPYASYFTARPPYYQNIFFINAADITHVKEELPELFLGRYNIAVFFWEFNDYFNFPRAFEVINEVFVFTEFVATAVRKAAPERVKVTKLPFPFIKNWEITISSEAVRKRYGIGEGIFLFIFNFDFNSVYERKNPEAILKAFELAFKSTDKVALILKTIHSEDDPKGNGCLQAAVELMHLKHKVIIINDNLDRNDFMNIVNASDCYISLHRSEGLGLGMLEAMSMGKPVIATNFGGNTDFMHEDNSLLVNYTLIPVKEGAEPYKPGWLWADANVEEAASFMVRLYNDRSFTSELGKRAQESVTHQYSNNVFVSSFVERIRS